MVQTLEIKNAYQSFIGKNVKPSRRLTHKKRLEVASPKTVDASNSTQERPSIFKLLTSRFKLPSVPDSTTANRESHHYHADDTFGQCNRENKKVLGRR
jgi:hypothetical protein